MNITNRFELAALLNRAAAAIETPGDLTPEELKHVAEDLCIEADKLDPVKESYTPGPWRADVWGAGDWTVSAPNAHYSVCHLKGCNNDEANARLISLAPELVDTIRALIFRFEHNGDESPEDKEAIDEAQALLARLEK